jgi:hypothetical protein
LQEWKDLPAPYKHFHVKVNPKDVEEAGPLWKAMYDWRLAVPMSMLVAVPLWMTGNLPGFDERLELSLIILLAGTALSREVAPIFKAMKTEGLEIKAKCVAWGLLPASSAFFFVCVCVCVLCALSPRAFSPHCTREHFVLVSSPPFPFTGLFTRRRRA